MATVSAVCVLFALLPEPSHPDGVTAIDKRAVLGRVAVGPHGLAGDRSADTAHHGGLEYAVYLYADEDAAWWSARLGREIPPGLFGENVRTTGIDVGALVIGQRLTVGESGLLVEVTAPRNPCATFARRMGEPGWVRRFAEHRAPGAYVRVLAPGTVGVGDELTSVMVPEHAVTVADLMRPGRPGAAAALLTAAHEGRVTLGPRTFADAAREAARGAS